MSIRALRLFVFCLLSFSLVQAQDAEFEIITPDNAAQLQELARYGDGQFTSALAWSPDGNTLAVGGSLGVWLYDARDWTVAPHLIDLNSSVTHLSFSADGTLLAYATRTPYSIHLRDIATDEELITFDQTNTFAFSPDSHLFAVTTRTFIEGCCPNFHESLQLWDTETLTLAATAQITYSMPYVFRNLMFSPDGTQLASALATLPDSTCGNIHATVKLWDVQALLQEGETIFEFQEGDRFADIAEAEGAVYSPDGTLIASTETVYMVTSSGRIHLRDVATLQDRLLLETGDSEFVRSWVFSPDSSTLAANIRVYPSHTVRLWDTESGAMIAETTIPFELYEIAYNPSGTLLAGVSWGTLILFDPSTLEQIASIWLPNPLLGYSVNQDGSAFSYYDVDGYLHLWSIEEGAVAERLVSSVHVIDAAVNRVRWSERGDKLLFYDEDNMFIWDASDALETVIRIEPQEIVDPILNDDGTRVAIESPAGEVKIWDTTNGSLVTILDGLFPPQIWLKFSPNGAYLLTVDYRYATNEDEMDSSRVELWDVESGARLYDFGIYTGRAIVQFSPDSSRLGIINPLSEASNDPYEMRPTQVHIIDLASGDEIITHEMEDGVGFTPDLDLMLMQQGDWSRIYIGVFDVTTGQDLSVPGVAIYGGVRAINPQATQFVTYEGSQTNCGGDFRSLFLWDIRGQQLITTIGLPSGIDGGGSPEFSPDGGLLVVSDDYRVRFWDTLTGENMGQLSSNIYGYTHFTADGTGLLTLTDGTVRLWGVPAD
jgi:WD40 repeat protein